VRGVGGEKLIYKRCAVINLIGGMYLQTNVKVGDIMTRDVAYVTIPGDREQVLEILREKQISGVPVVKDGKLVGIITRSDLLRNPSENQIAMLMTRNPISVTPDATLENAAMLMVEHNIQRLPVVEDGKLVGIITVRDIINAIAELDIMEDVNKYLASRVVAVWSETPLPVVGMIMELADVKACPVLTSELELAGVVRDKDLIMYSVVEDSLHHSDMSSASDEDEWTWESMRDTLKLYYSVSRIKLQDIPVKDAMKETPTVSLNGAYVSEVARLMRRKDIEQVPVVTASNRLYGMVCDKDLIKCLID